MRAGSDTFVLACLLIATVAAICGLIAGFLSWRGGANPSNATLVGFGAFSSSTGLGVGFLMLLVQ